MKLFAKVSTPVPSGNGLPVTRAPDGSRGTTGTVAKTAAAYAGPATEVARRMSGARRRNFSVPFSPELARIEQLPRRDLAQRWTAADIAALEAELRSQPSAQFPCRCAEFKKKCPTSLQPIQAYSLLEARDRDGLMGSIPVGGGKTLIGLLLPLVIPDVQSAVLLIQANLRPQLLERDWPYYGAHWKLPNLAGGQWFKANTPVLHVITYNRLSGRAGEEDSDLLTRIDPDIVAADEAQNLRDPTAARTIRFWRFFERAEKRKRLFFWSGSLTAKSIEDPAPLAALSLGDGSPYPLHPPTLEEWACALDPIDNPADEGELRRFCRDGKESAREGFQRRRNDTPGIVAAAESSFGGALRMSIRDPGPIPEELVQAIAKVHAGVRPDGEEFVEQLQIIACARQLSAGFFHRWRFPRGESPEMITEWFEKRQAFNREIRTRLHRPEEHLDSPGLLVKAALRWLNGYTAWEREHQHDDSCYPPHRCNHDCESDCDLEFDEWPNCNKRGEGRLIEYPPKTRKGPKAVWASETFAAWHEIHDQVEPTSQAVWVSDFIVKDAAAWASDKKRPGIVWVEFPELGEKIAKAAGVPYYGQGDEASAQIVREDGRRSIVASIRAHGTGKNLQHAFFRNLVVNPPSDAGVWEQLVGRTHRQGQTNLDGVEVELYQHTTDYRDAFATALDRAIFVQEVEKSPQKLVFADWPEGK